MAILRHVAATTALLIINPLTTTGTNIPLITFDGSPSTTHTWASLNDPVMGGKSSSTFHILDNVGIFDGDVVDIPFLQAPGFIQALTKYRGTSKPFPDVSQCTGLIVRASTEGNYDGYKISFGTSRNRKHKCGRHSYGFKASLPMEASLDVQEIVIPFEEFSDCNDDATGLAIVTCEDDVDVCPGEDVLTNVETIAIWGEGVSGKVHIEILSIEATGCSAAVVAENEDILLATFDGAQGSTRDWEETNDPVMGGESTGTFTIEGGIGFFEGEVADVPFLAAPGFIKTGTTDIFKPFPDISHCTAIKITARTDVPYDGFRLSFGMAHPPNGKFFAYGYKTNFKAPVSDEFQDTVLPFTEFTDLWDDATGDAIVECKEESKYCPTVLALRNIKTLAIWAEGKNGKVSLEIQSVAATGCNEKVVEEIKDERYLRA